MSGGPILNNGTQSPARKIACLAPKKIKYISWKHGWMYLLKRKQKEIYEDTLSKEILSQKRDRKGDFRNVAMDLHL